MLASVLSNVYTNQAIGEKINYFNTDDSALTAQSEKKTPRKL